MESSKIEKKILKNQEELVRKFKQGLFKYEGQLIAKYIYRRIGDGLDIFTAMSFDIGIVKKGRDLGYRFDIEDIPAMSIMRVASRGTVFVSIAEPPDGYQELFPHPYNDFINVDYLHLTNLNQANEVHDKSISDFRYDACLLGTETVISALRANGLEQNHIDQIKEMFSINDLTLF